MKKRILYIILGVLIANVSFADGTIIFGTTLSFPYDGLNHVPTHNASCSELGTTSISTQIINTITGDVLTSLPRNVGTYKITVTITGACTKTDFRIFTITAKTLTITATGPPKVYGTALVAGVSSTNFTTNGNEVSGEVVTSVTLTPNAAGLSATTAAGASYMITPSLAIGSGGFLESNYNITYTSYTNTITKKPITITVTSGQTKVYGVADPTSYAYTLSTPLIGSDVLTGALIRIAGETVGPYAISQGTLTNANYDIAFVANNFTITKKPLTITATIGQTKVYGATDPTSYAYTLSAPLLGSDALTGALTRVSGETVGQYAISQGTLTNTNYDITYLGSDFTITKAALTIKAKPHTIIYNGTAYAGGNGVIPTGFASGESINNLTGTLTYGGTAQGAKNVGTYTILPDGLSSPNYNINYVSDNLEIKKAILDVTAGNQSVEYGTQLAKILSDAHSTYSGFLGSDDATVVSGTPSYLTNYTSSIPAGTNGIFLEPKITGLTSINYDFVAVNGTITINAAPNSYFQIPNAFVPGSLNEFDKTFRVFSNSGFPSNLFVSLSIYNRSGQFIKKLESITDSWDGRIGGVLQEADVYLWTATFIDDPLTKNIPRSGTFILLK